MQWIHFLFLKKCNGYISYFWVDTFPICQQIAMDILPIFHTQLLKVEFRHC